MRRRISFLIWAAASAAPALMAAGNLRVLGTTPTQVILAFEKPDGGTAAIEVSESPAFTSLVHDVDPALFPGSNQDITRPGCIATGSAVTCVIGRRTVELAADSRAYSRALRASTVHYFRVTWPDSSQETVRCSTKDPIAGHFPHGNWSRDPRTPGKVLWPTREYLQRGLEIAEPTTGVTLKTWALPGDVKQQFGPGALLDSGTFQEWLAWSLPLLDIATADRWGTNTMYPRWLSLTASMWFTGNDLSSASRMVDVCWGDRRTGCESPLTTVTLGTAQAPVTICNGQGTSTCTDGEFWGGDLPDMSKLNNNLNFAFLIRKHSQAADNTLNIASAQYAIGAGGMPAGTSAGFFPVCSGESRLSVNGFMHCMDANGRTYGLHPATGETRYLGTPVANLDGQGRRATGTIAVLWQDANNWFALGNGSIYKLTLAAAAQNDDSSAYISVDAGYEGWYDAPFVDMLGGQKIGDLIAAFDPSFDKTVFQSGGLNSFNGRYLNGTSRLGNQDTYGWAWVYDTGNGLPLGSGGNGHVVAAFPTFKAGLKTSWSVMHGQFTLLDSARLIAFGNTIAKEDTTGNQKFRFSYDAYWNGSTWVSGTAPNSSSLRMRLTSTWNVAWGAQPLTFQNGDPVSSTQSPHWLQKPAVGDEFRNEAGQEVFKITAINGQDSLGLDITVSRRFCSTAFDAITVGLSLNMQSSCTRPNGNDFVWDYIGGPNGDDAHLYALDLPGGGHAAITRDYQIGTPEVGWHACNIDSNTSCLPVGNNNLTQLIQRSDPNFAGVFAPISGNAYEGHPGLYPEPGGAVQRAVDIHPLIFTFTNYTITQVSGSLYKLDHPTGFFQYPLNRKHHPTLVSMGTGKSGKDVSGPASSIDGTSAHAYEYCVVLLAGECWPSSLPGEIYVNHPNLTQYNPMCTPVVNTPDDLCVEDLPPEGLAVGMYALPGLNNQAENLALYKNRAWMPLVQTANIPAGKGLPNTSNVKMLSLNWAWFGDYLIKLPRSWTLDTVKRESFVPVEVQIGSVPSGTATATVEFGYDELNSYGLSFPPCTTRQETCVATQATVSDSTPFYWASENYTGLACAGGCTVAIPGISGRVVYYRVRYRNTTGQVIGADETRVAAVP